MRLKKIGTVMLAGCCSAVLLAASPALAADPTREDRAMKLPESEADHLALAKSYEEKVEAWRKEAADHRAMAEAYKKARPAGDADAATMQKHCKKIADDAEKLAHDAEDTAKYHRLRAKELSRK